MTVLTAYKQTKVQDYSRIILLNKQAGRVDPTRTLTLRRAWMADMTRRFTYLKGLIRKAVVDEDVFGLREPERLTGYSTPGTRAFQFLTSSAKVDQFMDWLREQEKKGILQTTRINQLGQAVEKPWTDIYIEDSYKRGVQRARYEMPGVPGVDSSGGIGAVMATPFHADRVGLLYSRTYSDLKGITSAMDSQISRTLAQCFVDGDGPAVMARKLNERVDAIGKNRALTLARTETIRAHHSGMVQEYRNWGLAGVKVQAEWETAGFGVCPKCESLQGKVFTLDQIEGMIPAHPNCRCLALPVVDEEKKKVEEVEVKEKPSLWDAGNPSQSFRKMGFSDVLLQGADKTTLKNRRDLIGSELGRLNQKYPTLENRKLIVGNPPNLVLNDKSLYVEGTTVAAYRWTANFASVHEIKIAKDALRRTAPSLRIGRGTFSVGNDLSTIFRHEYGHHIHLGNTEIRRVINAKKWNNFYQVKGSNYFKQKVSRYAGSNPNEAFAETFAAYTSPLYGTVTKTGKVLRLPQELEDLMKEILGK